MAKPEKAPHLHSSKKKFHWDTRKLYVYCARTKPSLRPTDVYVQAGPRSQRTASERHESAFLTASVQEHKAASRRRIASTWRFSTSFLSEHFTCSFKHRLTKRWETPICNLTQCSPIRMPSVTTPQARNMVHASWVIDCFSVYSLFSDEVLYLVFALPLEPFFGVLSRLSLPPLVLFPLIICFALIGLTCVGSTFPSWCISDPVYT